MSDGGSPIARDDGRQPNVDARPTLSDIAAVLTALGLFCYGSGWLFYNRVYTQVGISAEAVGIGFDYLVVRSVLVLGVLAGLFFVASGFYQLPGLREEGERVHRKEFAWILVLFSLAFAVVAFFSIKEILQSQAAYTPGTNVIISLVITFLGWVSFVTMALWGAGYPKFDQRSRSPRHALAVVGMVALLILMAAGAVGDLYGREVRGGADYRNFVIYAPKVSVVSGTEGLPESCMILLGSRDEVTILLDPATDTKYFIPSINVTLRENGHDGCN